MTRQRLTVHDAARRLEISEDAVRMRIKRGNLDAEKEGNRLYVMLDDEPDTEPTAAPQSEQDDELRRQNKYLRQQLDIRTEELRRKDHIMAALTERLPPQLEPPETAAEESTRTEGRTGDQATSELRPWWRRIIGG